MPPSVSDWHAVTAAVIATTTILAGLWRYLLQPFGQRMRDLWTTIESVHTIATGVGKAIPRIEAEQDRARVRARLLFSAYGCGVFETDEHGRVLWVSDRYCEIVHRASEHILGGNWPLCIYPIDRGTVVQEWLQAAAEHRQIEARYRVVHPDGTLVAVIARGTPVVRDGVLVGYIGELCLDQPRADAA